MISIKKEGVLLSKTELGFENEGVLNPAAIRDGDKVHLYYRAVSKGNHSSIGYAKLNGPLTVESRLEAPFLFPQFDYESQGMEDPRITKIEETYYLSYTAYDGVNALGALALGKDLQQFDKKGLIVPQLAYDVFSRLAHSKGEINEKYIRYNIDKTTNPEDQLKKKMVWDKNLIFFPEKINGKICFLHRVRPDIQFVTIEKLEDLTPEFWQNYFLNIDEHIVLTPKYKHEVSYIGGGCPPIRTASGWLMIYHGVHDTIQGYVYAACAALLDLEDPRKEIARLPYALFKPELPWELKGEVNNVCFPTGCVQFDDKLYIYYGAADERIACVSLNMEELLKELLLNRITNEK